ncbi:insulinase family protein, partial [bacterium]|nr:insulinase family protein [bacterium]
VSHFLEHLFFKGTEKNPLGTFDKLLEAKGGVTNAATSKDFTHYYIKIPSKDFDLALNLHADMLLNPAIPQAEMDRERKVVIEEIAKDKNSPNDLVYDNLNELIYKVHPYKREVIGTKEIIENITRDEIFDYYNKHYSPENMVTVIVGDVNPDETAKKVQKAFSTDAKKLEKHSYKKEPPITSQRVKEEKFDCNSGYMMIGFRGTNAVHKDEFALDILAAILGDGRSSRFYQNIKEEQQLANSIGASNGSFLDDGVFYISTNFQPENKEKLKQAIFNEIYKVQKYGVTDEEVQKAKNIIERDTHYSRESVSNIATEMGYTVVVTGDPKNYDDYLEGIKKVTSEDVNRVARKYLGENKSAISIVMPENYVEPSKCEKQITNHNVKLVKSAYNTDKYILDTGATLLVNKHQNNDIVAFAIRARGGEFFEKLCGTANMMASTMMKGTKKYSQTELAKILDESGIKISPSSSSDDFILNVVTTKQQLPLTMDLLNEVVNNALFDNGEVEKARKLMAENIKSSRDIPFKRAMEEYTSEIYAGSIYSNSTKTLEKTLPKITRSNIIDYYQTIFYPQNLVISVNGDVDEQYIINEMSEIFNGKKGQKFLFANHKNDIPKRTTIKKITTPIKDLQTSWILIGWQTDGVQNLKDYATLQVIDSFMGTGMSSRLFIQLREKRGLAYQVGSSFSPNVLRGKYTLYIGTNPDKVNTSIENLMKQIEILKRETVSEKELQDAKDQLIGHFVLALETNLDKAGALAMYEVTDRGFDFVEKYTKLIQDVTAEDVKRVANKYFINNYVQSIVDKAR